MTKATKSRPARKGTKRDPETKKRALFVKEYLIDLDGTKAAVRAGYSERSARQIAANLLLVPEIAEQIKTAMEARSKRVEVTADMVLERMWAIANADASEISEMRRTCCRYCFGRKFKYQRTPKEMREAIAQFERDKLNAESMGKKYASTFDEDGGVGFDARRDPNPKCPECFGQGVETPFFKDIRGASKSAKLLYSGVEVTQHGLKVRTHDQTAMLRDVGKHLGMFTDKVKHSNDPENPMPGYVIVPAKVPSNAGGG